MSRVAPDLFGWKPPPYRGEPPAVRNSPTSVAAAQQIKKAITPLHKKILAHLTVQPSTDEEMQNNLHMSANTQRPRRRELQLMEKIEDSGETRATRSKRQATIWRITV